MNSHWCGLSSTHTLALPLSYPSGDGRLHFVRGACCGDELNLTHLRVTIRHSPLSCEEELIQCTQLQTSEMEEQRSKGMELVRLDAQFCLGQPRDRVGQKLLLGWKKQEGDG